MTEINAAAVKSLRDKTGLPMMKCKEALQATGGDEQAAIEWLRKDRHQGAGKPPGPRDRFRPHRGLYLDWNGPVGAMVELQCESAPVATNEEFIALSQRPGQATGHRQGRQDRRRAARPAVAGKAGKTLRRAS